MFDTETMAELCVKQGLLDQAIAIYRRMSTESEDPAVQHRYAERIVALERQPGHIPLETPGLRVQVRDSEVQIEWRLPTDTQTPTLQLLVLRRTADGIEADGRTMPLASPHGRTLVRVPDLHSVRAAAGRLVDQTFVPIVRLAPTASPKT